MYLKILMVSNININMSFMICFYYIDFSEFCARVRNDLLGLKAIPVKKYAKALGIEDPSYLEDAIGSLGYLILHMAKVKASEEEFYLLYQ